MDSLYLRNEASDEQYICNPEAQDLSTPRRMIEGLAQLYDEHGNYDIKPMLGTRIDPARIQVNREALREELEARHPHHPEKVDRMMDSVEEYLTDDPVQEQGVILHPITSQSMPHQYDELVDVLARQYDGVDSVDDLLNADRVPGLDTLAGAEFIDTHASSDAWDHGVTLAEGKYTVDLPDNIERWTVTHLKYVAKQALHFDVMKRREQLENDGTITTDHEAESGLST